MKLETFATHSDIVLFDGVCNLCNGAVNFIIRHDPMAKFKFAPLQSEFAKQVLKASDTQALNSIIYLKSGVKHERSTAVFLILKELDHPLRSLHHLKAIPAFLRDPIYDLIAATRYAVFGKQKECMVPTPEVLDRFLDAS